MARARNIKPGFFRNAELVELPVETRLLFIGLWGLADREGRLIDRPKQIKMEIYPADSFDVDSMLCDLSTAGFIHRYEIDEKKYIQINNFLKHQNPHRDEKASTIPAPCKHDASTVQVGLIPDSGFLIPESRILNPERAPTELDTRGEKSKPKPAANAALARSRIDENFHPDPGNKRESSKLGLDLDSEKQRFVAHYTATGDQRADWQAQFRKWLLDSALRKVDGKPAGVNGSTGPPWWTTNETMLAEGAKLGIQPLPGEEWQQFRGRIQAKQARG